MEIPEAVIEQVEAALNLAIGIALVKAPDQHAKLLAAAHALEDAINEAADDD